MSRLGALMEEDLYSKVLKYMKENNVKLEQEIESYYLVKDTNGTFNPKKLQRFVEKEHML